MEAKCWKEKYVSQESYTQQKLSFKAEGEIKTSPDRQKTRELAVYYWIQFANILVRIFVSMFMSDIVIFLFLKYYCLVFVSVELMAS